MEWFLGVYFPCFASQITSLTIVYSTVYSGADKKNYQISASLAFVREIHRGPVNSPHKWPVTSGNAENVSIWWRHHHMIDNHLHFSVDLCSYYTAFEVEKVRTVNYILASLHHDRMRGAMLFCPWVTFCSSKQSLKLYESPIYKRHRYEQNLKKIMRQSLVDVRISIARLYDLF